MYKKPTFRQKIASSSWRIQNLREFLRHILQSRFKIWTVVTSSSSLSYYWSMSKCFSRSLIFRNMIQSFSDLVFAGLTWSSTVIAIFVFIESVSRRYLRCLIKVSDLVIFITLLKRLYYFFDAYKYKIVMIITHRHCIKFEPEKPKRSVYERPKIRNVSMKTDKETFPRSAQIINNFPKKDVLICAVSFLLRPVIASWSIKKVNESYFYSSCKSSAKYLLFKGLAVCLNFQP